MSGASLSCRVRAETQAALFRQLQVFRDLPKKRFALARDAAREVKKYSAGRVRRQQSLEGGAFTPRSAKRTRYRRREDGSWRKKRRMLATLGKARNIALYRHGQTVAVGWKKSGKRRRYDEVAYKHQHGQTQTHSVTPEMKAGLKKWHAKLRHGKATRRMAAALLRNGYRLPVRGKNGSVRLRRVSAKWIQEHMSLFRAAWVLRMLVRQDVSKSSPRKAKPQTWQSVLPARPFLGVTSAESQQLLTTLQHRILSDIGGK